MLGDDFHDTFVFQLLFQARAIDMIFSFHDIYAFSAFSPHQPYLSTWPKPATRDSR